jgi:tetratricopeptide (TPR) repeat protein
MSDQRPVICRRCREQLQFAANFCSYCALPVNNKPSTNFSVHPIPQTSTPVPTKKVGLLFALGIVFLPHVFSWFTLQKGYSDSIRIASFTWLGVILLFLLPTIKSGEQRDYSRSESSINTQTERKISETEEERLRSEIPALVQQWSAELAEVETLERSGNVRDAYARFIKDKDALQSYLKLVPLPQTLVDLNLKRQELETRLKSTVEFLDTYDEALATQKQADQLIKEKNWIAADQTLANVLTLVTKMETSSAEIQKNIVAKYSPSRQRAAVQKTRQRIKGQVARAEKKEKELELYREFCGTKPECSTWDGECIGFERALKENAYDPDSIDVENCTVPVLTDKRCWVTTCVVKGKNGFGALISRRVRFSKSSFGIEEF